jgi:hypothetical protein
MLLIIKRSFILLAPKDVKIVILVSAALRTSATWSDRSFRDAYCSSLALTMEAVRTYETSVNFNHTARRCVPEGCHLHLAVSFQK